MAREDSMQSIDEQMAILMQGVDMGDEQIKG